MKLDEIIRIMFNYVLKYLLFYISIPIIVLYVKEVVTLKKKYFRSGHYFLDIQYLNKRVTQK